MVIRSSDRLVSVDFQERTVRHWNGLDLGLVASVVAEHAGIKGQGLGYTRVDGRLVFPFVQVDADAIAERTSMGEGPILDRSVLRDRSASPRLAPRTAVQLSGYVTVEPFRDVKDHLVGLRTWAPTCAAIPLWRPLDPFQVAQCDYFDHCAVACDGRNAMAAGTKSTVDPPAERPRTAWDLLRNEQMFQFALDTGMLRLDADQERSSSQRRMPVGISQPSP